MVKFSRDISFDFEMIESGGGISQDSLIKAKIIFVGSDGSTPFSKLPNFQKHLP